MMFNKKDVIPVGKSGEIQGGDEGHMLFGRITAITQQVVRNASWGQFIDRASIQVNRRASMLVTRGLRYHYTVHVHLHFVSEFAGNRKVMRVISMPDFVINEISQTAEKAEADFVGKAGGFGKDETIEEAVEKVVASVLGGHRLITEEVYKTFPMRAGFETFAPDYVHHPYELAVRPRLDVTGAQLMQMLRSQSYGNGKPDLWEALTGSGDPHLHYHNWMYIDEVEGHVYLRDSSGRANMIFLHSKSVSQQLDCVGDAPWLLVSLPIGEGG